MSAWNFAHLDPEHLDAVKRAEQSLGADYVIAFDASADEAKLAPPSGLSPATLDASRLECLQGLEQMLGKVLVAYRAPAE